MTQQLNIDLADCFWIHMAMASAQIKQLQVAHGLIVASQHMLNLWSALSTASKSRNLYLNKLHASLMMIIGHAVLVADPADGQREDLWL